MSSEQVQPKPTVAEAQMARKATWKIMRKKALVWSGFPLITLVVMGIYPGGTFHFSVMYLVFLVVYGYVLWSEWNSCMDSEKRYLSGISPATSIQTS